jgi:chorismate-pyruvate lyase
MTVMSLDTLGVTSTDGVANLLATILAVSATPATLLLEELACTEIRIEVLGRADRKLTAAEHYRLDAGPIPAGHHRTGLLRTASGLVAAETSLVILPQRIPAHARAALAGTSIPVGKILAPLGVQRMDRRALCRHGCLDTAGGDVAVESSAVLALDGVKVAIATERITGDFCRLIASSPDTTSRPDSPVIAVEDLDMTIALSGLAGLQGS